MSMIKNETLALTDAGSDIQQSQLLKDSDRLSHNKKEKSRDAARSRRGRENCQFYALATLLPVPEETSSQLDKASIIRLTMSFLQLQEYFSSTSLVKSLSTKQKLEHSGYISNKDIGMTLQSLDGFLIIINSNGRCLYVSNSISEDLGLAQVDVIGSNILNFIHDSDHEEFRDHLKSRCCEKKSRKFCQSVLTEGDSSKCCCSFFIRMKSTQPRRNLGFKSSGYKVVHVNGYRITKNAESFSDDNFSDKEEGGTGEDISIGFAGIAKVLTHAPLEIAPKQPVLVVKVDRSLRITFCEEQMKLHTNFDPDEVRGCTIYQFIHTYDLAKIRTCHMEILEKWNIVTPYYRWLLKNGTFIWVQSRCSIILEKHQNDEDHFLWITHVIARGQYDFPSNINVNPVKSKITEKRSTENNPTATDATKPRTTATDEVIVKTEKSLESPTNKTSVHFLSNPNPLPSQPDVEEPKPVSKLVKQSPEKPLNLKRVRSANSSERSTSTEEALNLKQPKMESVEERIDLTPLSTVTSCWNGAKPAQMKTGDVLDVNSTMWGNPPNREVANHSDLYTTVIHHHYPYGIDPNLLNSNPIFAKMLTTNYVTYESLLSRDAFILPPPTMNIFTPVLGAIPQLIPTQQAKLSYNCPQSVASIIDELRKDPIREKNPPNKVILSRSHIPNSEFLLSPEASPRTIANPPIFTFPSVSSMLQPLGGVETPSSNATPIFIHPVKLAHSTLNSLPI